MLEPLVHQPLGSSPIFPLLMSTFLLLIALLMGLSHRSPTTLYRTLYYLGFHTYTRFGHHLSLFYFRRNRS